MAKKRKTAVNWRSINNRLDSIDLQMQDAYKNTYNTSKANSMDLDNITNDIMGSIDALIADDSDIQGIPNISRLYNRLQSKKDSSFSDEDFRNIFEDRSLMNNLMDVYSKSRSIKQLDDQIDTVCKYMPKLQNALDILKDSVLVSETFSKDYLNLISGLNKDDDSFATRAVALKTKYGLEDLLDRIFAETSKYGECFVYAVPYKKAFEQILAKRAKSPMTQMSKLGLTQETVLIESGQFKGNRGLTVDPDMPSLGNDANGTFTFNFKVGTIDEVVNEYDKIDQLNKKIPKGLYEQFLEENALLEAAGDKQIKTTTADTKVGKDSVKFNQLIPDELKYEPLDNTANDGLVDPTKKDKNISITTPGCIVKILKRDRVFPVYIDDSCLGYYYLEYIAPGYADTTSLFKNSIVHNNSMKDDDYSPENDKLLKYLASQISSNLDAAFINANIDLSKEIYMILKYDEKFNITNPSGKFNASFIPAEDIHHHYFKMDPNTHRGISDLYDGLIPATIWCMLSLCTSVGIVTRGQDKRVYYVQNTGIETNVAKSLMNVVNQIKRGNFGIRQLESINNILGIVGKYNDYIIPTGPNGEPPVRFEMMQGQQIEPPTEMMQTMEENAINPTGVPLELVNATKGLDYAVHYTVSNSRFMTIVTKRQGKEQTMDSKLLTKIYNCEYEESTVITMMLPEPRFIAMGNTNSVIDNVRQYAQNIVDIYGYDMDDNEKAEFMNLVMRNRLASHINADMIDNLKSLAKVNIAAKSSDEEQQ